MDTLKSRLLPIDLVANACTLTKAEFLVMGDAAFLFALPDLQGDLVQGLSGTSTADGDRLHPTRDALSFHTGKRSMSEMLAGTKAPAPSKRFGVLDLRVVMSKTPHFIAPLRKRRAGAKRFSERISIGRARNNDIVLRHPDVSKFHAWLECDEEDQFYVGDGRSTNTTTLNGQPLGRGLELLNPGDALTFGTPEVAAVYCLMATLWELLREE